MKEYNDVFKGLVCLPGECHMTVKSDVNPVVDAARRKITKLDRFIPS